MKPTQNQNNLDALNSAASALSSACRILEELNKNIQEERKAYQSNTLQIAILTHSMEEIKEDISLILQYVRDGNGKPSLLSRVETLESKDTKDIEKIKGTWALLISVSGGFVALLTQLIVNWITKL